MHTRFVAGGEGPVEAANGARTRDPQLGKLVLYQLSYRRAGGGFYDRRGSGEATVSSRLMRGVPRTVWLLIAAGVAIRLLLAFLFVGTQQDIDNLAAVGSAVRDHPLILYDLASSHSAPVWPYPPGLVPWVAASSWLAGATGVAFHGLVQLAAIAADAVLALLVWIALERTSFSERKRIAAVALVALGPAFIAISGYHGQIDSVAIAPALAALLVWERGESPWRALWAGLLIGCGGAVKQVALVMIIALLPTARSRREWILLPLAALAVPLALLAPYLLHDHSAVSDALSYSGLPGLGGFGLAVHAVRALFSARYALDGPLPDSRLLYESGPYLVAAALALLLPLMASRRTPPRRAAVVVWLAVYALGVNFAPQYAVWGLPFFLVAGYLTATAAAQLALVPPFVLYYTDPGGKLALVVYTAFMVALWAAAAVALALALRRELAARPREPAPSAGRAAARRAAAAPARSVSGGPAAGRGRA